MNRAISLTLVLLAITAALPAAAQESGGLRLRSNPLATLNQIDAMPIAAVRCPAPVSRSGSTKLLGPVRRQPSS